MGSRSRWLLHSRCRFSQRKHCRHRWSSRLSRLLIQNGRYITNGRIRCFILWIGIHVGHGRCRCLRLDCLSLRHGRRQLSRHGRCHRWWLCSRHLHNRLLRRRRSNLCHGRCIISWLLHGSWCSVSWHLLLHWRSDIIIHLRLKRRWRRSHHWSRSLCWRSSGHHRPRILLLLLLLLLLGIHDIIVNTFTMIHINVKVVHILPINRKSRQARHGTTKCGLPRC
mmetsp:Transcript_26253/g.39706  ORF Transcript_26253/g.39706 Transcript_26253/m.39706 type:complete len:223 (+) Transcript_26253:303-971(+)